MNDAPKKRPLFQIHLSTCIILMFVAGGLMWANVPPSHKFEYVYEHGFPCAFYETFDENLEAIMRAADDAGLSWAPIDPEPPRWEMLALNIVFCGLTLAFVAFMAEWFVCRTRDFASRPAFLRVHTGTIIVLVFCILLLLVPNTRATPEPYSAYSISQLVRGWPWVWKYGREVSPIGFLADLVACIAVIVASAAVCEYLIRRRERRHE